MWCVRLSDGEAAAVWAMSEETLVPSLMVAHPQGVSVGAASTGWITVMCDSVQLHSEIGISSPREISLVPHIVMTR